MNQPTTFLVRIEHNYEGLSPNARKVADYLQQNPLDVINTSVAEIASITGTSKATVSRFFRQLGYESHLDVKKELRSLRASGYPVITEQTDNDFVTQELERVRQTWNNVKPEDIDWFTDKLCTSSRITVIGFRNSYPMALHFRQQLLQIRENVRLLPQPGQTLSEELPGGPEDELYVVFGFRRRPDVFGALIDSLSDKNVVLMGDPSAQIYKSRVSRLIICHLGQAAALDSYAAPMSVVSAICNGVLEKLPDAQSRIKSISSIYQSLDELE